MSVKLITNVENNKKDKNSLIHVKSLPKSVANKLLNEKLATKTSKNGAYKLTKVGQHKIINNMFHNAYENHLNFITKVAIKNKISNVRFALFFFWFVFSIITLGYLTVFSKYWNNDVLVTSLMASIGIILGFVFALDMAFGIENYSINLDHIKDVFL